MKHRAPQDFANSVSQKPPLPWGRTAARWGAAAKSFVLMIFCKEKRIPYVMHYLFLMEGQTFERCIAAFRDTPAGSDLLRQRPDFRKLFDDRERLRRCPPNLLGRSYAEFVIGHDLHENHYLDAALAQAELLSDDPARAWFHTRMDACHDVRHLLAGYGPDILGEICLLCFRFAQIRHPGFPPLIFLGFLNLIITGHGMPIAPLLEAYRRGQQSRLIDLLPWENEIERPLSVQRETLGLSAPKRYPSSVAPSAYAGSI